jgi:hypothetical protein
MERITRRSLLGRALMATAGTSIAVSIPASARAAAKHAKDPGAGYDPGFVAGRIVTKRTANSFVVTDADGESQLLHLVDTALVWKQGAEGLIPLETGDCLYARGRRRSDGTLDVSHAWVDIRNFQAEIVQAGRSELTTRIPRGHGGGAPMFIRVAADTEVDHPGIGHFVHGDTSHLQESDIMQIVGYGDPVAGTFTATRMFVLASDRWPSSPSSDPESALPARGPGLPGSPDTQCPYYSYGITSWFCCGGVLACGATCSGSNCGNPCGGAAGVCDSSCPTCRTDYNHMAWPQLEYCCQCGNCISDCGGNTCRTTCCSGLPIEKCGTVVPIYDQCTGGKSVNCYITDCGPCVRCVSPYGCQSFTRVKFDLTACAFSAIAPLSYGLTDVRATTFAPC